MQVLRKAAVLVVLGLSLGFSGARATPVRPSHESKEATLNSFNRIEPWWSLVTRVLSKAGCSINPLGLCGVIPATQDPIIDAGCVIDPLGRCLGH
jgi:hypothetical protein